MVVANIVSLDHVALETSDKKRLGNFYTELLGFEERPSPKENEENVIWLVLPGLFIIHVIENEKDIHCKTNLSPSPDAIDVEELPSAHHLSFVLSNFDSFVETLKEKGVHTYCYNGKRLFIYDPDGNLLEVASDPDQ